jgi:hypothetical protein
MLRAWYGAPAARFGAAIMLSTLKSLAIASIAGIGGLCNQAVGSEEHPDDADTHSGLSEGDLALNIYGLSLHADRGAGHNEINPGVGLRYVFRQPAPRWTTFGDAGIYYDSNRAWAKYVALGVSYRFAASWSAGAAVGYAQSRSYNNGKPFFAVIPGVAFEYRRVAYNAVLLPSQDNGSKIAGIAFFASVPLGRGD